MNDTEMRMLIKQIQSGWPKNKDKVPLEIRSYYNYADELSINNNLVFRNTRLIVPKKLRKDMLEKIHYNHLGIEKCKNRAREILFWPMMNKEIEDVIKNCEICMKFRKSNVKQTLINRELPNGPWETLGVDVFFCKNTNWLLTVDYFSKYVEISKLPDISTDSVVTALKTQFCRFGVPYKIYSDPGSQLNSLN